MGSYRVVRSCVHLLLLFSVAVNAQDLCSEEGALRLETLSVSSTAGRVEICSGGVWGTICVGSSAVAWSEKNAQVTCKELGFSGALNSFIQEFAPAPPTGTPSLYHSVACNGMETMISHCTKQDNSGSTCPVNRAAHVVCRREVSNLDVRLVGSAQNGRGAVEVYDASQGVSTWRTLCPDSSVWDNVRANAVCVQLGYESGTAMTFEISMANTVADRSVANINCSAVFTFQGCSATFQPSGFCSAMATEYAGVVCSSSSRARGSVRLFGPSGTGTTVSRGRVEVLFNGKWGAVCNNLWSSVDGQTVCREIGFEGASSQVSINPTDIGDIPQTTNLPIWLGGIECTFSSSNLLSCPRTDTSIGYASLCDERATQNSDALLDCNVKEACSEEDTVRIKTFTGSTSAGYVEICRDNSWESICAGSSAVAWSEKNAQVACKELGFSGALNSVLLSTLPSPPTNILYQYHDVNCNGTERDLSICDAMQTAQTCSGGFAAVVCRPMNAQNLDVRLVGNTDNGEGAVEVYNGSNWVSMCPVGDVDTTANAVCVQLGYDSGEAVSYTINPVDTSRPDRDVNITLPRRVTNITCPQNVFTLQDCNVVFVPQATCALSDNIFAGVKCRSSTGPAGSLRIFGVNGTGETGTSVSKGRIEILYDRKWGAVCNSQWSLRDGQTACRELGFEVNDTSTSISPDIEQLSNTTNIPIWLGDLQCGFNENKLSDCNKNDFVGYVRSCQNREANRDALLDCLNKGSSVLHDGSFMVVQLLLTILTALTLVL